MKKAVVRLQITYDYVFITHLPAFYKVSLYHAIARDKRVFVIFIGSSSLIREPDFTATLPWDHDVLFEGAWESRSWLLTCYRLLQILRRLRYRQLVIGGWELSEFWLAAWCSPKARNALALESSVFESQLTGYYSFIKRLFLSRVENAFAAGLYSEQLLKSLKFQGKIRKTQGVGLFSYPLEKKTDGVAGRFLYVGRLAPEKNINCLLQAFQRLPHYQLTLVGRGPEEASLRLKASPQVTFVGHVVHSELAKWYTSHDVLILPSFSEPWGLVVEEALSYGLPVIVSSRVGCRWDWVQQYQTGVVFDPWDVSSLVWAIHHILSHYATFRQRVQALDFEQRDVSQVRQYLEALA